MPIINTALTLKDLPPPPPGKSGWPWTEQTEPLPERMLDCSSESPRISIVTPSYNYGRFIEETIRSVLLQGYPNLEYIIIDGGSTDNTVEIIRKYEKYFTYWVSEPDDGQTDAINKGYQHCTGDIFAWLNADDAYATPTCLERVCEVYKHGYELIVGQCVYVNLTSNHANIEGFNRISIPVNFSQYLKFWSCSFLHQPAVFIAKDICNSYFPLDTNLNYTMDYQLFLRVLSQQPNSIWLDQTLVKSNLHGQNKTMKNDPKFLLEFRQVALEESRKLPLIKRIIFQSDVEDNMALRAILSQETFPSFWQVFVLLLFRPTLARWLLFWKVLFKSAMGVDMYLTLKRLANRS